MLADEERAIEQEDAFSGEPGMVLVYRPELRGRRVTVKCQYCGVTSTYPEQRLLILTLLCPRCGAPPD